MSNTSKMNKIFKHNRHNFNANLHKNNNHIRAIKHIKKNKGSKNDKATPTINRKKKAGNGNPDSSTLNMVRNRTEKLNENHIHNILGSIGIKSPNQVQTKHQHKATKFIARKRNDAMLEAQRIHHILHKQNAKIREKKYKEYLNHHPSSSNTPHIA